MSDDEWQRRFDRMERFSALRDGVHIIMLLLCSLAILVDNRRSNDQELKILKVIVESQDKQHEETANALTSTLRAADAAMAEARWAKQAADSLAQQVAHATTAQQVAVSTGVQEVKQTVASQTPRVVVQRHTEVVTLTEQQTRARKQHKREIDSYNRRIDQFNKRNRTKFPHARIP
jgi:hypothetical protein